ncbi:MAG TPA: hypothetical protein PK175_05805 [Syntrophales bacterium]|jgi:hypothetical protein|nr:hypothetical protein [Syntrophales bacterium]HOU78020.1 hypothetical protein [Syntrophales bacterium]HPC33013.1 hypothetical protein [Syntrophales bacterium]HQG34367.1 hypothetical protein [Syntrophales bacterium]HQI36208.1 hypothetical protein [Syntrophales bacterium]
MKGHRGTTVTPPAKHFSQAAQDAGNIHLKLSSYRKEARIVG